MREKIQKLEIDRNLSAGFCEWKLIEIYKSPTNFYLISTNLYEFLVVF